MSGEGKEYSLCLVYLWGEGAISWMNSSVFVFAGVDILCESVVIGVIFFRRSVVEK